MGETTFTIEDSGLEIGKIRSISSAPAKDGIIVINDIRYKIERVEQRFSLSNLGVAPQSNPEDIYPRDLETLALGQESTIVIVSEE